MKRFRLLAISWLVILSAAWRAGATDLRDVITDITITTWNEKDGLPAATIFALAQDHTGYLWVGTRLGLMRFDGVRFVPWESISAEPLPARAVRSLLVTSRGEMWVGFANDGRIARIADGHVAASSAADHAAGGAVLALAEDHAGVVWAATEHGLFAFDGSKWARWTEERGIPAGAVVALFVDRAGTLYAAGPSGMFVRRPGANGFEHLGSFSDTYGSLAQSRDGTIWVTDPREGYRLLAGAAYGPTSRQGRGVRMLVDRKGNLWAGTGGQGLWRMRNPASPAAPERTSSLTGLLGDGIYALLEDRDGNIWAGTTEGLNRVTPRTIEQIIDLGLVRGVERQPDGRVWVSTVDKLVSYSAPPESRRVEIPVAAETRAMAVDDRGVWLVSGQGVSHLDGQGRESFFHWPDERQSGGVEAVVPDHRGGIWLLTRNGIQRWNGHALERIVLPVEIKESRPTAAFVDSTRRAWFAFENGHIVSVGADGAVRPLSGLEQSHVVRTFAEDGDGRIWLGGDALLAVHDGERTSELHPSDRLPLTTITAIVPDDRGSVWLGSPIGVVHLDRSEFIRAAADSAVTPRYTVYNRGDGVAGTPVAVPFNRGAMRTSDGRVWFVTTRGITVLDPHVLEARSAPLSVRFEGALTDDQRVSPDAPLVLPAGTRKLEIDYTVVNLTTPLKSRFRYRLDPFDHDWVEAGARRQAFYTNLRPGRYVFRVAAAGVNGVNDSEASWPLTVEPMFYQTATFAALGGLGVGLMVLAGWRLRERYLRRQFSLLIAERARLGREIHDTLLQGLVAIALQFDSLAHELAPLPRLHERFSRLRDRVEEYIREARRSIWDLHTQPPHRNLVESLRRAGEFATDGRDIAFILQVQGTPFECPPRIEEQVVRIAQEASLNSVRHAAPRRLSIDLLYDDEAVTLKVADDGRGFDSQEANGGGHLGIRSMYERARSVGGALTLVTAPGRGTEVIAVLPVAS